MTVQLKAFAMCACLLALSGCFATPQVVTQTKTVILKPPKALMRECTVPVFDGVTAYDLLPYTTRVLIEFRKCANRMGQLNEWYRRAETAEGDMGTT